MKYCERCEEYVVDDEGQCPNCYNHLTKVRKAAEPKLITDDEDIEEINDFDITDIRIKKKRK